MKPVNLNQLLFHNKISTLSFFQPPHPKSEEVELFIEDMKVQLSLQSRPELARLVDKHRNHIKKILAAHPTKSHGFFLSEELQGYVILEGTVEPYCMIGYNFHVRPLLEEFFGNPEYMVVNVSLYDIKVYRGDFQHLEIIQHYEFDQLDPNLQPELRARFLAPGSVGLVPYKTIMALKTLAQKVMDQSQYQSLPVIVTGLEEMKNLFLKYYTNRNGMISHGHEDFYEKTCVEILDRCKQFRYAVMDFYSAQLKERLKQMMKSKRFLSDLGEIIQAIRHGKVIHLILPSEKKLWGKINLITGEFELHKKEKKRDPSVDILNQLAEEVMKNGGKIQILGPHFFPQDSHVLAILRSKA